MTRILDESKLYGIVGGRIRMARRSLTPLFHQDDVAKASKQIGAGLSRSSVANIEGGKQSITLHQLYRLAEILKVEPAVLLPARNEVFDGPEDVEDSAKREWLAKIVADQLDSKKHKE